MFTVQVPGPQSRLLSSAVKESHPRWSKVHKTNEWSGVRATAHPVTMCSLRCTCSVHARPGLRTRCRVAAPAPWGRACKGRSRAMPAHSWVRCPAPLPSSSHCCPLPGDPSRQFCAQTSSPVFLPDCCMNGSYHSHPFVSLLFHLIVLCSSSIAHIGVATSLQLQPARPLGDPPSLNP